MANQFLGLSLFIMLLSFFIILNAISNFEITKSRPVLNSLTLAFSNKQTLDITPPGLETRRTQNQQLGSTLDRIEELFRSQISSTEAKQNRLGTVMHVRLPFNDFQNALINSLTIPAEPAAPNTQTVDLLPMLVSLLETQRNVTYKMDMVLNVEEELPYLVAEQPGRFAVYNRAISEVAFKLEDSGLPKVQLSAGLETGEPGMIDLIFSRYQPFNPLGVNAPAQEREQTQEEGP